MATHTRCHDTGPVPSMSFTSPRQYRPSSVSIRTPSSASRMADYASLQASLTNSVSRAEDSLSPPKPDVEVVSTRKTVKHQRRATQTFVGWPTPSEPTTAQSGVTVSVSIRDLGRQGGLEVDEETNDGIWTAKIANENVKPKQWEGQKSNSFYQVKVSPSQISSSVDIIGCGKMQDYLSQGHGSVLGFHFKFRPEDRSNHTLMARFRLMTDMLCRRRHARLFPKKAQLYTKKAASHLRHTTHNPHTTRPADTHQYLVYLLLLSLQYLKSPSPTIPIFLAHALFLCLQT